MFRGDQHHSSAHPGPDAYVGKKAVVIGSNNSAHDICKALYENGVDVTMVQRSSTHIVKSDSLMELGLGDLYSERAVAAGMTTEKADLTFASLPYRILHEFQIPVYNAIRERDKEFYERLEAAGFELDWGDDDSGLFMKYLRRGSGYYIDVGACDLVADGEIKLAHGQVERLTEDSVVLADGTELPADVVVYATGFGSMNGWAADLIGQDVADKVGKVWGLGSDTTKDPGPWEGEQRNMWKPTQQENLWFHGGNLHQSRHYSLYLALQLKARYEGIPTPGVRPAGGPSPELTGQPPEWLGELTDPLPLARGHHRRRRAGLGPQRTTSRRSPSCAANASSRCAPRRSRCSTPMRGSPTCAAAASACTTSGATRRIPRGLWRRTTLEQLPHRRARTGTSSIDLDALARADDENWVWAGADVIEPDHSLALISLSRGGSDAAVVREFDMRTQEFVADGFEVPEAKTQISWEDENTVLIGTDLGRGFADRVRVSAAGQAVAARARRSTTPRRCSAVRAPTCSSRRRGTAHPASSEPCCSRAVDFFNDEVYELRDDELIRIDAPTDATVSAHRDWLLIELRTDWYTGPAHVPGRLADRRRLRRIPRRHSANCTWYSSPTTTPA